MSAALWRGTVSRITGGYVYVTIPRLSGKDEHGPLEPLYGVTVAVGTPVLVGLVEDDPNRAVLIRRF